MSNKITFLVGTDINVWSRKGGNMNLGVKEMQEIALEKVKAIEKEALSWANGQICNEAEKGNFWVELSFPSKVRRKTIDKYLEELRNKGFEAKYENKLHNKISIEWYIEE